MNSRRTRERENGNNNKKEMDITGKKVYKIVIF